MVAAATVKLTSRQMPPTLLTPSLPDIIVEGVNSGLSRDLAGTVKQIRSGGGGD
jgi:hypothetical protein